MAKCKELTTDDKETDKSKDCSHLTIQGIYQSSSDGDLLCTGTQYTLTNTHTGDKCVTIVQGLSPGEVRDDQLLIKTLGDQHVAGSCGGDHQQ